MSPTYDSFSPDNQRRLNHDAAARNGEHITPEFEFSDLDLSGRKDVHRPGFEKAMSALLDRRIKTLYVAKLDRLTRKGMGHVGLILDELERVGGRIVFVAEGLDTSKQGARQVIAILAEQARGESDAISWRIGERHAHNRRMGLWKAKRPFGYLVVDGKLKPHPIEAPIVRRVVEAFLDGATLRDIARWLNDEGIKHRVSPSGTRRHRPRVTA
jgi:site-specific DNA recombinase